MRRFAVLLLLCAMSCDRDRPPAPTEDQHAKLDEAESMLNDMAKSEEGAAPEDTAPPSNQQG